MLGEVMRGEVLEKELNSLIEKRALKAGGEQQAIEDLWKASAAVHREQVRRTNSAAWYAHHMDQADRIRRTMTALIAEHEAAAAALLEEALGITGNERTVA